MLQSCLLFRANKRNNLRRSEMKKTNLSIAIIILFCFIQAYSTYAGVYYSEIPEDTLKTMFTAAPSTCGFLSDINVNMSKGSYKYEILVYRDSNVIASLGTSPRNSHSLSFAEPPLYCPGQQIKVKHLRTTSHYNNQKAKVTISVREVKACGCQ
jgi:hypothetical protein